MILVFAAIVVAQASAVRADAASNGSLAVAVLVQGPVEEALTDEDRSGSVFWTEWTGAELGSAGVVVFT